MTSRQYAMELEQSLHTLERLRGHFEQLENDLKILRKSSYQTYYNMYHTKYTVIDPSREYVSNEVQVGDDRDSEREIEYASGDQEESNEASDSSDYVYSAEEMEFQRRLQKITQNSDSVRYRPTRSHRISRDRGDDEEYSEVASSMSPSLNELPVKLVLPVGHPIRESNWTARERYKPDNVEDDHYVIPSISLRDLYDNQHIQDIVKRFK